MKALDSMCRCTLRMSAFTKYCRYKYIGCTKTDCNYAHNDLELRSDIAYAEAKSDVIVPPMNVPFFKFMVTIPTDDSDSEDDSDEIQPSISLTDVMKLEASIEFCKSWGAFKTRAARAEKVLKAAGFSVLLNAEKPRKGSFVVTCKDGTKLIELLNLERPFPKLKSLDVEAVLEDALKKYKE